jgi:hypothetical protein
MVVSRLEEVRVYVLTAEVELSVLW